MSGGIRKSPTLALAAAIEHARSEGQNGLLPEHTDI